jgi:hypothetical protein
VEPTESFPPTSHDSTAGWLYHQETGRIAANLPKDMGGEPVDVETE